MYNLWQTLFENKGHSYKIEGMINSLEYVKLTSMFNSIQEGILVFKSHVNKPLDAINLYFVNTYAKHLLINAFGIVISNNDQSQFQKDLSEMIETKAINMVKKDEFTHKFYNADKVSLGEII